MSEQPLHAPPLYASHRDSSAGLRSVLKHVTSRSPSPSSGDPSSPVFMSPPLPSLSPHPPNVVPPAVAPGYTPKVSFDTFENPVASMFSFTLQVKTAGYVRNRHTRVFLCAAGPDESGKEALDWSLEALVQDGDELVVCRGIQEDVFEKDHDPIREEARQLLMQVQAKSVEYDPDRKLSIIVEFIPGRVTETIDRLIALYRPDSVVVGTHSKKAWQGMVLRGKGGMGSVSKYCLTHSPVPIIVVRPERKTKKSVEKRRADPKRGTHFDVDGDRAAPPPMNRHGKTYDVIGSRPLGSSGRGNP